MFFELSRAGEVEGGMAPDGIVEPIDVAANGLVCLLAGVEDGPPDELGFQGLEERLHHGVVIAIPLAGHRDQDAVLLELGLIVDRAILAAAIRMMDQPGCRTAHGQGFAQSGKRARSRCSRSPVAQPTTRRANRSITTARYSQPSRVQTQEMSAPHFLSGAVAVKF